MPGVRVLLCGGVVLEAPSCCSRASAPPATCATTGSRSRGRPHGRRRPAGPPHLLHGLGHADHSLLTWKRPRPTTWRCGGGGAAGADGLPAWRRAGRPQPRRAGPIIFSSASPVPPPASAGRGDQAGLLDDRRRRRRRGRGRLRLRSATRGPRRPSTPPTWPTRPTWRCWSGGSGGPGRSPPASRTPVSPPASSRPVRRRPTTSGCGLGPRQRHDDLPPHRQLRDGWLGGGGLHPELRVEAWRGLRVVDASVMPTVPRGNTNAPTIAIAERPPTSSAAPPPSPPPARRPSPRASARPDEAAAYREARPAAGRRAVLHRRQPVGGPEGPTEVGRVDQPPAGRDRAHRPGRRRQVQQIAPAAFQAALPDPAGHAGLLGLEQLVQGPDREWWAAAVVIGDSPPTGPHERGRAAQPAASRAARIPPRARHGDHARRRRAGPRRPAPVAEPAPSGGRARERPARRPLAAGNRTADSLATSSGRNGRRRNTTATSRIADMDQWAGRDRSTRVRSAGPSTASRPSWATTPRPRTSRSTLPTSRSSRRTCLAVRLAPPPAGGQLGHPDRAGVRRQLIPRGRQHPPSTRPSVSWTTCRQ